MFKYATLLICFLLGSAYPSGAQPSLFYNGHIFTSDPSDPYIGYFIVEDERISETGDSISVNRIAQFKNKIDLQGKTVIPGIVDSHIHFIDGALGLLQVSLANVQSQDELATKLKSTSGQKLDGIYVARDLGSPALPETISPVAILDQLIPDSPAILFLKSGHAAVANTAGLKKLGFNAHTKIQDGTIGKDSLGNLNRSEERRVGKEC